MIKKAVYYEDIRRWKQVKEFIDEFDDKTKGKILARIEYLADHWYEVRRPYVDKVDGDLYELRVDFAWNNVRIIYAYMFKDYIVLLHGFKKKSNKIKEGDKLLARKRMADFQERYVKGLIKLR